MSTKDNGGPAFPAHHFDLAESEGIINHHICRECETVSHCSKHGCIPYVEGSLRPAIDQKVRETLDLLDGHAVPTRDGWSSTMTMIAVLCSIGGMSAGWLLAMAFDAAGFR